MTKKEAIDLGGMRLAPYSPCVSVKDHIWVAALKEQAAKSLEKIDGLLAEANSSKADLVMVTVLLTDMADFGDFNEVYGAWLEGTILPARAAFAVRELPGGALVEIVAEAFRGSGSTE
ncbi:MAG: reactive intermediate/imine deaminase [Methanobacteriota archaeon]|nr:MAG: reactive intermediate/imine deaminase [Euryarchaeota archaeon]